MHKFALLAAALIGPATSLLAQSPQEAGFWTGVLTGATTRGSLGVNAGENWTRYDNEDYVGYGSPVMTGPAVTGYNVNGVVYVLQDQNDATPETYQIHMYSEDVTTPRPNFPTIQPTQTPGTGSLFSSGVQTQATTGTAGGTISAFIYTITFGTAVVRPAGQDFFIAVEHQANAGWAATDGGSCHINLGVSANFPTGNVFDLRGAGLVSGGLTSNSYGAAHNPVAGTQAYGGARQYRMVPMVNTLAGTTPLGRGVVLADTNQAAYVVAAPGTASMFSGNHPDAASPPSNPGRADNSSYQFIGAPAGAFVITLVDFGTAPETALSNFVAGSNGVLCLGFGAQSLGFAIASGTGIDTFTINWTPTARTFLTGNVLAFEGIVLDPVNQILIGGPCGVQRY